jgi:hypothetical protein
MGMRPAQCGAKVDSILVNLAAKGFAMRIRFSFLQQYPVGIQEQNKRAAFQKMECLPGQAFYFFETPAQTA